MSSAFHGDYFFSAESKQINHSAFVKAVVQGPFFSSNQLIVFSLVMTYLHTMSSEHSLSTETIFITIALINPLRLVCTLFVPYSVQFGSEALVTVTRIQVRTMFCLFRALICHCFFALFFRYFFIILILL